MTEHIHHPSHHHRHPQENGLAIASFVLGIVSLAGFGALTGIPAIITGVMGLKNPVNKGLAVAGLVTGIISTVITVLVILLFIVAIILAIAADTTSAPAAPSDYSPDSSHTRSI